MKAFLANALIVIGIMNFFLAFLAVIAAVNSLAERARFGSGPMFADVEIFVMLSLCLFAVGAGLIGFGRRLTGNRDSEES